MAATWLRRTALTDNIDTLVRQAQQGDKRAFDVLYKMHQGRIVAYCVRLLGNKEHGEEVAQEVLLKAWVHLPSYRFDSPFDHWLLRIATNACRNRYRTQETRRELPYPPELSGPDMEAEILRKVYYQHLLHTIRQTAKNAKPPWDALDWSILHLLYVENVCEAREVARRLGKSEDTVKYRIYKRINLVLKRVQEQ